MFHNRISQHLKGSQAWEALPQTANVATVPALVMVPCLVPQAAWQVQLYRLAYEQAVAQTSPPRHFSRFFSVWN